MKMFEKLIESEPERADFKTRRSYFMVSSLVVGTLFATAVVISIFAADIHLGSTRFELTELIAPPEKIGIETETVQPQPPAKRPQTQSQMPTRQLEMVRIDETPIVPTMISVVPNTQMSRPLGDFKIDATDSNPDPGSSGRDNTAPVASSNGLSPTARVVEVAKEPEPPPVMLVPVVKPKVSGGVLNGKATHLPKPVYSAAAVAVHAQGKVDVQVMIDETGRVVSANAVNGHPLLRNSAEQAARRAKFTTTYLSDVPVRVTGVIIYNFTR